MCKLECWSSVQAIANIKIYLFRLSKLRFADITHPYCFNLHFLKCMLFDIQKHPPCQYFRIFTIGKLFSGFQFGFYVNSRSFPVLKVLVYVIGITAMSGQEFREILKSSFP